MFGQFAMTSGLLEKLRSGDAEAAHECLAGLEGDTLELDGVYFRCTTREMGTLGAALQASPHIRVLNMRHCNFAPKEMRTLGEALQNSPHIEKLCLGNNTSYTPKTISALGVILQATPYAKELVMRCHRSIDGKGIITPELTPLLVKILKPTLVLNVSGVDIDVDRGDLERVLEINAQKVSKVIEHDSREIEKEIRGVVPGVVKQLIKNYTQTQERE